MIITVTLKQKFNPDCYGCNYFKQSSHVDDAYGYPKTVYESECSIDDINNCHELKEFIENEDFGDWEFIQSNTTNK